MIGRAVGFSNTFSNLHVICLKSIISTPIISLRKIERIYEILVIEDDFRLARLIARVLEEEHFTTDVANTGDTGLEMALRGIYDVAIIDWMLPAETGLPSAGLSRSPYTRGYPDADGPGTVGRSRGRAGQWRGRLPVQAVRV